MKTFRTRRFLALLPATLLGLVGCQTEETVEQPRDSVMAQAEPTASAVAPVTSAPPPETGGASAASAALAATPAPAPVPGPSEEIALPPKLQEVIQLITGGVGESVVLAFIENSPQTFRLTADQIVYARDVGVSETVIAAMINHKPASASPTPAVTPLPSTGQASSPSVAETRRYSMGAIRYEPLYSAQTDYDYFYASLAPYGAWSQVPGYGWCWQPTVAVIDHAWRPYLQNGHWVWTNHGWYWQSNYSWGWAPFHYGRWDFRAGRGWVWIPDRVWGPAWVTWRYSDDYCGWAALPPGSSFSVGIGFQFNSRGVDASFDFGFGWDSYNFVPTRRFNDPTPWRHRVSSAEVERSPRRPPVVNNFFIDADNVVINNGIDARRISTVTQTEIRRVNVRELPADREVRFRPDQLVRVETEEVLYRPRLLPGTGNRGSTRPEIPASTLRLAEALALPVPASLPPIVRPEVRRGTTAPDQLRGGRGSTPASPAVTAPPAGAASAPAAATPQATQPPASRAGRQSTPPNVESSQASRGARQTTPLPSTTVTPPAVTPAPPSVAPPAAASGNVRGRGNLPRANQPARGTPNLLPNTSSPAIVPEVMPSTPPANGTVRNPLQMFQRGATPPPVEPVASPARRIQPEPFIPPQTSLLQPDASSANIQRAAPPIVRPPEPVVRAPEPAVRAPEPASSLEMFQRGATPPRIEPAQSAQSQFLRGQEPQNNVPPVNPLSQFQRGASQPTPPPVITPLPQQAQPAPARGNQPARSGRGAAEEEQ